MWRWLLKIVQSLTASIAHLGKRRHPHWARVRANHLKLQSKCQVCGTEDDLEVHHEIPFDVDPSRELDPTNLYTLCRPHHFTFGHLCNWASWNANVRKDAEEWREKIKNRPRAA